LNKLIRNIAFILLAFSLLSLGGAGFLHSHSVNFTQPFGSAQGSSQHNCQACVLTNALSTIDIGSEPEVFGIGSVSQTLTIENYSIPYSDSPETSQSRAPPIV
jgi:hypothetical protein